ncbi:flagellar biosynthetic protein FliR [Acidocella sp.]|uniref:flagellar biosynthetic protein FliR n=1 Tax=Acidocella sp. TaxID=50710 RepID=UPI002610EECE|nr:flagellar biosynthetic protein FliR [Acidocella sp.]
MVISESGILLALSHFLWPLVRISGFFMTAPVYGSAMIPRPAKALLAMAMSGFVAWGHGGLPPLPGNVAALAVLLAGQFLYGVVLALALQIVVSGIACAGEICGLVMGLSFAQLQFRDSEGQTSVLYDLMLWIGLMGFMAAGGPVWLMAAFYHSFDQGMAMPSAAALGGMAAFGQRIFAEAVELALPVIVAGMTVNLVVGIVSVFSPSLNLMSIGFPLMIYVCMAVFAASIPFFGDVIHASIGQGMVYSSWMIHHVG